MVEFNMEQFSWLWAVLPVVIIWSLFWKGLALWHSARKANTVWFLVLLVVNSVGVLELIYLFTHGKLQPGKLFKK